ncbi:MAG: MetS family NSS transporter small subunit [Bacteroidetes bacterium]|nr:MetS family NSS transporter small subunit [Bacteroidota bacterium]
MKLEGIITLFVVAGIVWGGLFYFLYNAVKFERNKKSDE